MAVPATDDLDRFDITERLVHWVTAALMLTLIGTGFSLYVGPLSTLVGRRDLLKTIHIVAGLALLVPLAVALVLPRQGSALRADARRINRFDAEDRRWLRRRTHARARTGKFNAGQKLNASFLVAAGIVLLGTGVIMQWPDRWSVDLRTGATFVHDWFAIAVLLAVFGHIVFALRDPITIGGMLRGRVPARWARRVHPRWYEEVTGQPADKLSASPSASSSGRAGTE